MAQGTCSIEGCERGHLARGWCSVHYRRWRKHGDPLTLLLDRSLSATERFWSKVDVRGPDECWLWTAGTSQEGYGQCRFGKMCAAHRVAYVLLVGPIPEGLQLDHVCHNIDLSCAGGPTCPHRRCVNPAHLEPVTGLVNYYRGRTSPNKTHCPQGHPYAGDNLHMDGNERVCLTCRRAAGRRHLAKKRAANPDYRPPNAAKTHCLEGHPLSGENLYVPPSGGRHCHECRRAAKRRHYHASKLRQPEVSE